MSSTEMHASRHIMMPQKGILLGKLPKTNRGGGAGVVKNGVGRLHFHFYYFFWERRPTSKIMGGGGDGKPKRGG